MDFFNLLLGGGAQGWTQAALLVCLFWAALTDRVQARVQFRVACLFFGAAMLAPIMIQLFIIGQPTVPGMRPQVGQNVTWATYTLVVPPALMTLSTLLALDSVIPRRRPFPPLDQD